MNIMLKYGEKGKDPDTTLPIKYVLNYNNRNSLYWKARKYSLIIVTPGMLE